MNLRTIAAGFLIAGTCGSVLPGCTLKKMIKMSKEQELTVTPDPLELHGDSVKFNLSSKLPAKMLKKNTAYTVTATYKYGEESKEVGKVVFKSEDFPKSKTEAPKISKNMAFFYEPDMIRGELVLKGTASNVNGKTRSTPELPVATGIITTPRLLTYDYFVSTSPHGYNNQEELIPNYVEFYFNQGSSTLRRSEKRSDRADFLQAFIAKKNPTRSVVLTGAHSPEGRETVNTELANERAEVIKSYYMDVAKKNKLTTSLDTVDFITKAVVQDWTPLMNALKESKDMTPSQIQQVMQITNGSGTFMEKEDKLHQLPFYGEMFRKVYPELRRTRTEILTIKPKKSDATIALMSSQIGKGSLSMDSLRDDELLYGATLTPDLNEKEVIYLAATKKNDSPVAHNNLAAAYLMKARKSQNDMQRKQLVEQALTQLKIAVNKEERADVLANMAAGYLMQGKYVEALQSLDKATQMGATGDVDKAIKAMKGIINIRMGDYTSALYNLTNSFKEEPMVTYNKGLAQLLTKSTDQARASIDEVIASGTNVAEVYYLQAVIAARQNRSSDMATALSKAISMKNDLRMRALNDIEFRSYFDNPVFKSAVK